MKELYSSKIFLAFELCLLVVLPLTLIRLFPDLVHFRLVIIVAGLFYVYFVCRKLGIGLKELGITSQNFRAGFLALIPVSLLAIVSELVLFAYNPLIFATPYLQLELSSRPVYFHLITYLLVSSPAQEIVFRTYLIPRLEYVSKNHLFLIIFTALIFGTIHLPLNNPFLTGFSSVLGIFWAANFLKHRNLFALSLSHFLIGSVYIYLVNLV